VRDERVAPKGWPSQLRARRGGKVSRWHSDWARRVEGRAEFRPQGRREGSDYNLHFVDIEAPLGDIVDFDRRAREIDGRDPATGRRLPDPDAAQRFRGALVAAAVGDALGRAVDGGAAHEVAWSPDLKLTGKQALTEFTLPNGATAEAGAVTQQVAFTLEGVIRAGVVERTGGSDPISAVQHAYQRWLYTQPTTDAQSRSWADCTGSFTASEPDGWLIGVEGLRRDGNPNPDTIAALERFARTGQRSRVRERRDRARGGDVVPRAASPGACFDDPAEAFRTAVSIAVLTHNSPDDCFAAGALAVILHQQVRDRPFSDCLDTACEHLKRWPGHARVLRKIEMALDLSRNHWTPTTRENVQKLFGGSDGADALGLAVYCAIASDYVREALQLAMNYSAHRPVATAITGMLIGAECGLQRIPADLRAAAPLAEVVDILVQDAITEFSPDPPNNEAWFHRYPRS
jgi:ADP-ribosylglycohydrolase